MANFKITSRKRRRTTTGSPQAFHLAKFLETMSKLPGSKSPPDRHDDRDLSLALSRALSLEPARVTLENMFAPVRDTLIQHEKAFYDLRIESHNLRQELDELKKYTRRNALRVYNRNWKESTSEDTDKRIVVKGSLRLSDCTTNLTASRHVVVHVHHESTHHFHTRFHTTSTHWSSCPHFLMVASTPILYPEPWASLSALSESTILARDTPVALDSPSMRETLLLNIPRLHIRTLRMRGSASSGSYPR